KSDPSRRLSSSIEPGHRIAFSAGDEGWFAAPLLTRASASGHDEWETAPSSPARPAIGCLRAASGDAAEYVMVCRQLARGQIARISVRARHRGVRAEAVSVFTSAPHGAGLAGDLIRLQI